MILLIAVALLVLGSCSTATSQTVDKPIGEQGKRSRSDEQTQPASPLPPITILHPEKSPAELEQERQQRALDRAIQKEISNTTRGLFWLAIVTAIVSALALTISTKAANAAKDAAEAATRQANHAEDSVRQAKAALDATITASHVEQRAWVGVIKVTAETKLDIPVLFKVHISNSGRTPATQLRIKCWCRVISAEKPFEPIYVPPEGHTGGIESSGVLFPNGTGQGFVRTAQPFSDELHQAIARKEVMAYVWTRITYRDVFNEPHRTDYCAFWDGAQGFSATAEYNEAD